MNWELGLYVELMGIMRFQASGLGFGDSRFEVKGFGL